jgi:hypothetical protein
MESLSKDLDIRLCPEAEKSSIVCYVCKIHFNIIRSSMKFSSKYFLLSSFTEYNSKLIFQLPMNATYLSQFSHLIIYYDPYSVYTNS